MAIMSASRDGYSMDSHLNVYVVPCDNLLSANWADLDLDIDHPQRLGADIDLHKARINRLVELSEPRNKSDGTWGRK